MNALLQKEMTRKEFIATIGLITATAMGLSGIIKLLTGKSLQLPVENSSVSSHGFGASPFGR